MEKHQISHKTELQNNTKTEVIEVNATQKFKDFANKFISSPKVAGYLATTLEYTDRIADFIVHEKSKKYERDIVAQSARAPINFGVWVIFVTFGIFGGWAACAPLDTASHAGGIVVLESHRQKVQHKEGGIIKEIYVKNGDEVVAGQKLLLLADVGVSSTLDILINQLYDYEANRARLQAQRNNADHITFPEEILKNLEDPKVKEIYENQQKLFSSAMEHHRGTLRVHEQLIAQSKEQLIGYKAREEATKKQLAVVGEQLDSNQKLVKQGFGTKKQLLEYEASYARAKGELGAIQAELHRAQQEISSNEIKLSNAKLEFVNKTISELKEYQLKEEEVSKRIETTKDSNQRLLITAPQDGIVHNFHYQTQTGKTENFTVGAVIGQGMPIMEIVPQNDKLIVEAHIKTQDVDAVRVGQKVKVKITAFKSRNTPDMIGRVTYVGADLGEIRPDENGHAMAMYKVLIDLDKGQIEKNPKLKRLRLQPGMQADVSIISATKTFLQYMLDPITDSFSVSFSER